MKMTPLALLSGSALLSLALASPAVGMPPDLGDPDPTPVPCGDNCLGPGERYLKIKNCIKTEHGVRVRIKMRDNGEYTRIRLSHPDGRGDFYEPKIRRTKASVAAIHKDATAIAIDAPRPVGPSIRTVSAFGPYEVTVRAIFKLRNGKSISLGCRLR